MSLQALWPAVWSMTTLKFTAAGGGTLRLGSQVWESLVCISSSQFDAWVCVDMTVHFIDVFQMAFTQSVILYCDSLEPRGCPCFSAYSKSMCVMTQPQRPAEATCVSCASSAKWNCKQTTPEVLENLVLFREPNRTYFCQRSYIRATTQTLMIRMIP